jgi:hypothetical protein
MIPEKFDSIQFNSEQTVIINGKPDPNFEFSPNDYDYSDRNEIIDHAFKIYLSAPFINTRSFSAQYRNKKLTLTVRHDDEITYIADAKKENPPNSMG